MQQIGAKHEYCFDPIRQDIVVNSENNLKRKAETSFETRHVPMNRGHSPITEESQEPLGTEHARLYTLAQEMDMKDR